MGKQRAKLENWLALRRDRTSNVECVAALLAVADACDAAIESGKLSEEHLRAIVDGMNFTQSIVWSNTVDRIILMQRNGIDMAPALLELSKSKKANVRYAVMCCLAGQATPNPLLDELLIAGLADKSHKVCFKAAQLATIFFGKRWLAPFMTPAAERDPAVAKFQNQLREGWGLDNCEEHRQP